MLRRLRSRPLARVVKLVDTGDLKSPDHCDRAGSSPAPGTTKKNYKTIFYEEIEVRAVTPGVHLFTL